MEQEFYPVKQIHLSALNDLDKAQWLDLLIDQNIKVPSPFPLPTHTHSPPTHWMLIENIHFLVTVVTAFQGQ
jgi:hypothetical protein